MQLSLQNFTSLVQGFAAAVQSSATALVDFAEGAILRAVAEASASTGLWMQYLWLQVLSATRAATSVGPDLDTWMADFGVTRLPAVAASGQVTFSRFTATQQALIPVGANVVTADGTQTFTVIADTTNAAYSAAQGGFVIAAGVASLTCTVQALTPGAAGNVLANTITLLASAVPGVDTVTNAQPMIDGADAETDAALRARFANFLSTRSRATPLAVQYAIQGVQQGLQFTIQENVEPNGTTQMGNFVVTIDDGSGYPSSSLLAAVTTAISAVRPIGSTFTVQAPVVTTASVQLTIASVNKPALLAPVQAAVLAYIDGLGVGATLAYSRIATVAYGVDASITNVSGVTVNGSTADITVGQSGVVKAGTVTVS